ncbi:hypothetical protein GCM10022243_61650 [Saccharothrix violaceirubra]|uniref:Putative metal-dependent HD superfamily phosphohydrolase n=1 Tax=Saccharothrix violaceirubra TaxID=413306 RepID=A0A7W7T889_9PSEU|nr:HD domain-containing protein [Saccharothrix violaceirubra]MBB4968141.1 putative metal-dependent HD superfamily phosphohydrolase [Saccharothrix violaceirubra]
MTDLDAWWDEAVAVLGGTVDAGDLAERYAEPHRGYHNADHVRAVVRDVLDLAADRSREERAVLVLAALAHDVVYDGVPGQDERRSAEWVRARLDVPERDRVAEIVLATVDHRADDDLTTLLLDADLAVLGGDTESYERYRRAVRAEYAHVTDEAWREGRAKVLESLLGRDPLYRSDRARARWEARARVNLAKELSDLR